jgi:hypothetical protein
LIFIIFILGSIFILLGTLVDLAKYPELISGYQQLSDEEKQQLDIHGFARFFKRFHLFLAFSFILFSLLVSFYFSRFYNGLFIVSYPILAYIFYIIKIQKFIPQKNKTSAKIAASVLAFVLILCIAMFFVGLKKNVVTIENKQINISGIYSESFYYTDIEELKLINEALSISHKQIGYAMGEVKKGYFRLENGEKVKLILHSNKFPILYIKLKNGKQIFYSISSMENKTLYHKIHILMQES